MGQETSSPVNDSIPPSVLKSRTLDGVAEYIRTGRAKRIVVLTGAGISTSAGIPDFRSPETGLYANLARLNLPYAEAVFDMSFFRVNPTPFYLLAHELYPGKYRPTIAHSFISLLNDKNSLMKCFTQNIDCLEREAGVADDKMIEAHGSFAKQRCIECQTEFPDDTMREYVMNKDIPHCQVPQCNGLVKPDIVFFGEQLPAAFFDNRELIPAADLCIVMGTSLTVHPFAGLPQLCADECPRILINKEPVGDLGSRPDDVLLLGDCDEGVKKLADACGWGKELWSKWQATRPHGTPGTEQPEKKEPTLEEQIDQIADEVDQSLKLSKEHNERTLRDLDAEEKKADMRAEVGHEVFGNLGKSPHVDVNATKPNGLSHVFPHLSEAAGGQEGKTPFEKSKF